jgi:SAM-dependent methyltransferase
VNSDLRTDVWAIADRFFMNGMRLLDLGCGAGEDAIHFAGRGLRVTAVDVSPKMIGLLKSHSGEMIDCHVADMQTFSTDAGSFDAVLSNLSALNYVPDLRWLSHIHLTPGAHLLLTTLGRVYPLASLIDLIKGQPRLAVRRFGGSLENEIDGMRFEIHYHSIRSLRDALGTHFRLKEVIGLRAFRPIPELHHLNRYEFLHLLEPVDRWWCSHRSTATLSDQFVSVWQFLGDNAALLEGTDDVE